MTEKPTVSYGPMEIDKRAVPVGRVVEGDYWRPSFVVWERSIRRRVFETWRESGGAKVGRWTWEYL